MKRGQSNRGPTGPQKTTGIEWIGGTVLIPGFIAGQGEPFQPEALLWMGADGDLLGSTLAKPGELLAMASECLQSAIEEPECGSPHRPTRVRVASAELADAVRAGHPGLDVVCAPTPELDEFLEVIRERFAEAAALPSYLSAEIWPDAMASFFRAAAALYRAQPWELVPDDESLFSVTIDSLGMRNGVMSVIGQMGQSFGIILFDNLDDFEAYVDAGDAIELQGEAPDLPPHITLNFERDIELAPSLRQEITDNQWEVAGADAHPWLVAVDEGLAFRQPTGHEVVLVEAIALALTHIVAEKKALRRAWDGGEPVVRTLSVATNGGEIDVTLCTPYMRVAIEFDPSHDIVADLAEIGQNDGEIDYDMRDALEEELLRRFAASPEAKDLDEINACCLVMDLANSYLGQTIAQIDAIELRQILLEIIPRKASIDASEARGIITEIRALYKFMKREFGLEQADSCLRILGGNIAKRLETALSDSSNFGMAKALVMEGAAAGFDIQSKEGLEAWLRFVQDKVPQASISTSRTLTPHPPQKAPSKKKSKKKSNAKKGGSKATRAARPRKP